MNRKNLTLFIVGILISSAVALSIYNEVNKPTTKPLIAKSEMGTKDDPFARFEFERRMLN